MFPLFSSLHLGARTGLEGERKLEKNIPEPLSERRNFFLGSYLGIPKDPSIAVGSSLLLCPIPD